MYTIRSGDTMSGIAQRHGVSLTELIAVNPEVRNPSLIETGRALRIPGRASSPASTSSTTSLRRGQTGAQVRELQRKLQALGFLSAADVASGPGVFGPRTQRAVMEFQVRNGLKKTGVVGSYTQAALTQAMERRSQPAPVPSRPTPSPAPAPSGSGYVGQYNGARPAAGTTNTQAWEAVTGPVQSHTGNRSAARYADVINQFAVGVNPRYRPRNGNTYCNIFVWDVTRAMGAELPHWVGGRELNANSVNQWLHTTGGSRGWKRVDAKTAQAYANAGRPSVASWRNPNGIGHIGMVRPGEITSAGPALAQAGSRNFNYGHVTNGFGSRPVEYWVHA